VGVRERVRVGVREGRRRERGRVSGRGGGGGRGRSGRRCLISCELTLSIEEGQSLLLRVEDAGGSRGGGIKGLPRQRVTLTGRSDRRVDG
jgi:hypothetical protein